MLSIQLIGDLISKGLYKSPFFVNSFLRHFIHALIVFAHPFSRLTSGFTDTIWPLFFFFSCHPVSQLARAITYSVESSSWVSRSSMSSVLSTRTAMVDMDARHQRERIRAPNDLRLPGISIVLSYASVDANKPVAPARRPSSTMATAPAPPTVETSSPVRLLSLLLTSYTPSLPAR